MSVCYYQKENSELISPRSLERYRFINIEFICFNINKVKLTYVLNKILTEFCDASVIGYKCYNERFWCKTYEDKFCRLHIELEICSQGFDFCEVKIIPLIGTDKLIKNFVSNLTESIELYTTSSFFKAYFDEN